nr:alpha-L-fucosidase [uncultured bacterium]
METLPFRQVHLDFHTSPHIPAIGADFDPAQFAQSLQEARVNSISVFAKCHHGYSYYPTRVGTPHPHLQRDLLGEMVEACHSAGIRVQAYTTVVWDELAWAEHPEWRQIYPDGRLGRSGGPLKPDWKNLCPNTSYSDYVIAQIEEVLDLYPVDGIFIDIVRYIGGPCICTTCLRQMQAEGVDPQDKAQLYRFSLAAERRFMRRTTEAIRAKREGVAIFYNSRLRVEWDEKMGNRPELDDFTHLEIESLPGGFWGYSHFPLNVRYFQTYDRPLIGMTGRFHTTWGDFGGLRNRAALEFECFQALAQGAGCSIGDQLHPRGQLDPAVYQRIGEVYAEVERREAWVQNTRPLPEVGVLTVNGAPGVSGDMLHSAGDSLPLSDLGALFALEQQKVQFQFLDASNDLSPYQVVILPDQVAVDDRLAERLRAYLRAGGKLLVSDRSGLQDGDFTLAEEMGVHYAGPAPYAPDYLLLEPEISAGIELMAHSCEQQGSRVILASGARVLARSGAPYFNRTWDHFCSHQYTPMAEDSGDPVAVEHGNVIYLARPLFREYAISAKRVHKQVIGNCLARLLPAPRVGANNLPSTAIVTVRQQGADLLVHLLHYVHQRRGQGLDVIEDALPLVDIELSVRAECRPQTVQLVPELQPVEWSWQEGYVHLRIPRINGYQIVQLQGAARE